MLRIRVPHGLPIQRVQTRSKYISIPHKSYPTAIHAGSQSHRREGTACARAQPVPQVSYTCSLLLLRPEQGMLGWTTLAGRDAQERACAYVSLDNDDGGICIGGVGEAGS
jgi:hypothetical protein